MNSKSNSEKVIDLERRNEESWESALADSLKKAADNIKPSDHVRRDIEKHYSSPDVPLASEDEK